MRRSWALLGGFVLLTAALLAAVAAEQPLPVADPGSAKQVVDSPTQESQAPDGGPASEAMLQRHKHHDSPKTKCYYQGKPIPCPEDNAPQHAWHELEAKYGKGYADYYRDGYRHQPVDYAPSDYYGQPYYPQQPPRYDNYPEQQPPLADNYYGQPYYPQQPPRYNYYPEQQPPPYYYQEYNGEEKCNPGSYLAAYSCDLCPKGFFCPDGVHKVKCSPGLTTVWSGAVSRDQCVTPPSVIFSPLPSYNTSGVVVNPKVLVLSATSVFAGCTVTTLVLPSSQAAGLGVDSILLGAINGFNETSPAQDDNVLLCQLITRVIRGVSTADGNTILTTQPATLLDLVMEGDFNATAGLDPPAPIDMSALLDELTVAKSSTAPHQLKRVLKVGQVSKKEDIELDGIAEADVSFKPLNSVSVSGGVQYSIDGPTILGLLDPSRIKEVSVRLRLEVGVGFELTGLASASYSKAWSKDLLSKVPSIQAFFPCIPAIAPPVCRLSLKPEAALQLAVEAIASLQGLLTAYVGVSGEVSAGYDNINGGFLRGPSITPRGEVTQTLKSTCQVKVDPGIKTAAVWTLGIGPSLDKFDLPEFLEDINDVLTVRAPLLDWVNPISLDVTPDSLPDGSRCDTCNLACPSGRFSYSPALEAGSEIELVGLVKKAAELLDLGTELPLKTPVELPFGTPGVCVRLPNLFNLIQPVCCAEGGVTDSVELCNNATSIVAVNDAVTVAEGSSVSFNPLANDLIPLDRTAVVSAVGAASNGTVEIQPTNVTYTPTVTGLTAAASDAFTVTVLDSAGNTSLSTTSVTILPLPPPPSFTWITPTESTCSAACNATLGAEWRPVNGGNEPVVSGGTSFEMCAGLIDLPGSLGQQWLVGRTTNISLLCEIQCATDPCWDLPPGATRDEDNNFIFAFGAGNPYTDAGGPAEKVFPGKCACVPCTGDDCDSLYWTPSADAAGCPHPTITPQPGETFPSTVYSSICRSLEAGMFGYTGWVNTTASPSRCAVDSDGTLDYSVWCPDRTT